MTAERACYPTRYDHNTTHERRVDPETGQTYTAVISAGGEEVYKNRSVSGWGYTSHLTRRQKVLIRWALRQRARGQSNGRIAQALNTMENGWVPGPGQYPVDARTIRGWEATWTVMARRGKEWPEIT